jgi:hypothetical protein
MIGMKRRLIIALLGLGALCASPAFADVTVKSTVAGKGMATGGNSQSVTYIKGSKMRTEITTGDTTRISIFDLDAQKMYTFDSKKKEADVYDIQKMAADMQKNVQVGEMKVSVKPNGQTKNLLGKSAAGYDMEISLPATMGGAGGMTMTVTLFGPMWIVKGAPGAADYMNFYKNAVEKGWFFSDPRAAKAQPGQAKAMAEMYRQMAATGGVPYEHEMNIKMSGEGPMAGVFAKMGNITMTTTVTSVETTTLAADLFAVPAGYKLKEQK